jgi:3D (Asp-Asp-Asp) domain-containing protein
MNKRWRKRIDIYMGMNRKAALKWGRKKVELSWKQKAV